MDKFKVDKWRNSVPVLIERYGKPNLYGDIVGINTDSINTATVFWVLENLKKHQFDKRMILDFLLLFRMHILNSQVHKPIRIPDVKKPNRKRFLPLVIQVRHSHKVLFSVKMHGKFK